MQNKNNCVNILEAESENNWGGIEDYIEEKLLLRENDLNDFENFEYFKRFDKQMKSLNIMQATKWKSKSHIWCDCKICWKYLILSCFVWKHNVSMIMIFSILWTKNLEM